MPILTPQLIRGLEDQIIEGPKFLVVPNWNPVLSRLQLSCKRKGFSITNIWKLAMTSGLGGREETF